MQENARQGSWNGSLPPFGYRTASVEKRGQKVKKVPAMDDVEAAVVRRIFDPALDRAGMQIGVKAIVNHMNESGCQHCGKPIHIYGMHRILTASTYSGIHHFNCRESRTGRSKAQELWITVPVPQIFPPEDFELIRASLCSRSWQRVPPRFVGNPTLLTGIARCATWDPGMTLRTGKSGRYRYYTCAGCAQKGKTICPGRSILMAALDGMILEHLADRLFTPKRLKIILEAYIARSAEADTRRREQLAIARRALTEAQGRVSRLLELVEKGLMEANDPMLKYRLDAARHGRQAAEEEVRQLNAPNITGAAKIAADTIARLATAMCEALQTDDPCSRNAYRRLFVDQVIVNGTEIRLRGPTASLAKAAAARLVPAAASGVSSLVRHWRPVRDSNPCYQRERLVSWASRRTGQTYPAGARPLGSSPRAGVGSGGADHGQGSGISQRPRRQ
jgi:site-specific DNA recombinase